MVKDHRTSGRESSIGSLVVSVAMDHRTSGRESSTGSLVVLVVMDHRTSGRVLLVHWQFYWSRTAGPVGISGFDMSQQTSNKRKTAYVHSHTNLKTKDCIIMYTIASAQRRRMATPKQHSGRRPLQPQNACILGPDQRPRE